MFEYDNTHVLNVNMKVTIIPCFLDFKHLQSVLYILCTGENYVISLQCNILVHFLLKVLFNRQKKFLIL